MSGSPRSPRTEKAAGRRGVDFKDYLEKGELMARVRDSESSALRATAARAQEALELADGERREAVGAGGHAPRE